MFRLMISLGMASLVIALVYILELPFNDGSFTGLLLAIGLLIPLGFYERGNFDFLLKRLITKQDEPYLVRLGLLACLFALIFMGILIYRIFV